jgi:hypothetical protein
MVTRQSVKRRLLDILCIVCGIVGIVIYIQLAQYHPQLLEVGNNAGQEFDLGGVSIPRGSVMLVGGVGSANRITIRLRNGEIWHYDITNHKTALKGTPRQVQVEPDGSFYVLSGPTKGIVDNLPPQPEGFPLRPEKVTKRDGKEGVVR